MLATALASTMLANVFINGAAFLIPALHLQRGLEAKAGLMSSMPSLGLVVTLIAWATSSTGSASISSWHLVPR